MIFPSRFTRKPVAKTSIWRWGPAPPSANHAFVVDQRLASSIDGDLNGMAGLLVKEFDNNVEQADAGAEIVDDGFSNLAFAFEKFQAMLRVCELALQGIIVRAAS